MFTTPSTFSAGAFLLLCLAIVAALLTGVSRSAKRDRVDPLKRMWAVGLVVCVWLALTSLPAMSGWAEARPMPRLMLLFAAVNLVSLVAGLSPLGRWLAESVAVPALAGFQVFRLFLELILHDWASAGVIPGSMTWTGSNWDVMTGITAGALAPFIRRSIVFAWIINVVGLVLLLNVCRVVVMSSPLPFAWPVQPTLQLAFHVPYVWILPLCVGGALFGHVVLTRALLRKGRLHLGSSSVSV